MLSGIKVIAISAALIALEPMLISPRSFAQYLNANILKTKLQIVVTCKPLNQVQHMQLACHMQRNWIFIYACILGCWQLTLGTSDQFITKSQKQPSKLKFTSKANKELPVTLIIC